ncbi:hypothetical protein GCM10009133_10550 [Cocleimonas flava]|uniref:Bleomycin resistance protein n=1 Tax=Cocleimonas flava TaxID=634765 RepID=A0A4R1EZS7_9GAMM|nr:VOC family protein [Cocleimonas flava]TCJ87416.1 putative glyoxalase superfamily protein PhnB [Cocleimonas flava]
MSIQPFIRCNDITVSLPFYTEVLDFNTLQAPDPDPTSFMSMYAFLERDGDRVHLSQHAGDGVFGNVIYVNVTNLDEVYKGFTNNGLTVKDKAGITMQPVEQTWGMKEFSVADPDGNRLTFGQDL